MRIDIELDIRPVNISYIIRRIIASHKTGPETNDGTIDIRTIKKKNKNKGAGKSKKLGGFFIKGQKYENQNACNQLDIRCSCSRISHAQQHEDDSCEKYDLVAHLFFMPGNDEKENTACSHCYGKCSGIG